MPIQDGGVKLAGGNTTSKKKFNDGVSFSQNQQSNLIKPQNPDQTKVSICIVMRKEKLMAPFCRVALRSKNIAVK